MTLLFGIYPGGLAAEPDGTITPGPPESAERIRHALVELHGGHPFLVRGYVLYSDARQGHMEAPPEPWQYADETRGLELVVCFHEPGEDLTGWLRFIRTQIREHGRYLRKIQIGEEANHAGPGGDGGYPAVRRAIVEGVLAARDEVARLGLSVRVGCNSTPIFDPAQEFWTGLRSEGGQEFVDALGYVGLDFFPDVFRPIAADQLDSAVAGVLTGFRSNSLAAAGIPDTVPMHVTENGWATRGDRSPGRQAEVIETVVRAVDRLGPELNLTTYQHFALRDADSDRDDVMYQFGLLRSDYRRKPAFDTYRRLIAELSG